MTVTPTKDGVEFNDSLWQLAVTRNMSFWHQWVSVYSHYHHMVDFGVQVPLEQVAITFNGTETHVFLRQSNYALYNEDIKAILYDPARFAFLRAAYPRGAEELLAALEACRQSTTLETWQVFVAAYRRYCAGLMITASIGRIGAEELARLLQEAGVAAGEVADISATVTYPDEHTPLFTSQRDLLKIGARLQRGELTDPTEELTIWLAHYEAIPVNFNGDGWSLQDAQAQLDSLLQKDCGIELANLERSHEEKIRAARERLERLDNPAISTVAHVIAVGTYLNEFRKNVFCRVSLSYREIFALIAEKGGSSSWRDCFYLTAEEMTGILRGTNISLPDIIRQRSIVGYYSTPEGDMKFLEPAQQNRFVRAIHSIKGASSSEPSTMMMLKGFSANRGRVTGRVKVVIAREDFDKVERGDILVTTMTSVDFVPIMEKAAAFVTNEGGITSHASIVAREMNKPCIIGTKIATKVLKDGDMVEVDAESGMVKILHRK